MWLLLLSCRPEPAQAFVRPPTLPDHLQVAPVWPAPGAVLSAIPLRAPRDLPKTTVYLMAGHGNGRSKTGNLGVHGQLEAEVNLWTVAQLARRLEATDRFEVLIGRKPGEYPSYGARARRAKKLGADVFIELHTDARGSTWPWALVPGGQAYQSYGSHGFSVLYNEGGSIGPERRELARAIGREMSNVGLFPYGSYGNLYENDDVEGVFIDRRGLMMLRRPSMPSIIIETHNAKDFEESLRWREPATLDAFASAVAEGIRRYRTPEPRTNPAPIRP